jgi:Domain of unknown function (DUF4129)
VHAHVRGASRAPLLVAVTGLVVMLTALLDTRLEVGSARPSVRLAFTVPEILGVISVAVAALAGFVVLLAVRRHRVRRGHALERASHRLSWWGRMLAELGPVGSLLIVVAVLWLDGGRTANALLALGRALFPSSDPAATGAADRPVVSLPWLGWAVGLFEVALALMALAVALALLFAERIVDWWGADAAPDDETGHIAAAADDAIEELDDEPDARRGILACYRRFEQAAARARVPRAPWQTPEEFMRDAGSRLPLPALAVERLTRLFELARFSHHPLRPADRDVARTCLADIRASLAGQDEAHAGA